MSGSRAETSPFQEWYQSFPAEVRQPIEAEVRTEAARLEAELLAANPRMAHPENRRDLENQIFAAWESGDGLLAEALINGLI